MEESVCSVLFFLEVVTRDDMKWKASLIWDFCLILLCG